MFEQLTQGNWQAMSEDAALLAMTNACRNPAESLASMKSNPFGQLITNTGAAIRWNPTRVR